MCMHPTSEISDDARIPMRRRTRERSGTQGIGIASTQHRVLDASSTTRCGMKTRAWGLVQLAQGCDALCHPLLVRNMDWKCLFIISLISPSPLYAQHQVTAPQPPAAMFPCRDIAHGGQLHRAQKTPHKRCLTAP